MQSYENRYIADRCNLQNEQATKQKIEHRETSESLNFKKKFNLFNLVCYTNISYMQPIYYLQNIFEA